MTRIAVDALGGDRAPDEIVAGALEAAADGIDVVLYGPAGLDTGGLPLVDARRRDRHGGEARRGGAREAGLDLVAAVRAVADGDADAVVSAGNTGAMLAAGPAPPPAPARRPAARDRRPDPDALRRLGAARRAARTPTPARAPAPVRATWARSSPRRSSTSEPDRAPALDRRGAREGQPAHARGARAARARPTGSTSRATPRAATCCAAPPTSSSPTASPATSR